MKAPTALVCLIALAGIACEGKPVRPSKGEKPDLVQTPSQLLVEESASGSPREIATPAEVDTFLAEWVKSQNQGQFGVYSALYAKEFTGTKMVGPKRSYFDRSGWLEDREAMFERPFSVQVKEVQPEYLGGTVIVSFEQTWKSATFEDRGEKRLQLVREDGKLRISAEAMLSSESPGVVDAPSLKFEQGALATKTAASHALLIPGKVELVWASEHPVYLSDRTGERSVSESALPGELRRLKRLRYEVFDKSGSRCVLGASGFKIHVEVVPPHWQTEEWNGRTDARQVQNEGAKQPVASKAQRALALWRMAASRGMSSREGVPMGLTLAVELESSNACKEIVWGRELVNGAKKEWTMRRASESELSAMRAAARTHPLAVDADKNRTKAPQEAVWVANLTKESARVAERSNGEVLYLMDILGPDSECGESLMTILWRKHGDGMAPLPHELPRPFYTLRGNVWDAVDLNGDGQVEFITDTTIVGSGASGYQTLVDHTPELLGCWC